MLSSRQDDQARSNEPAVSMAGASPGFARRGVELLAAGKAEEALEICIAGTNRFPWYATGLLTLGKCYDALGRSIEAMLEYRRALKLVPDSVTVRFLLQGAERHEQEAFEAFAESRRQTLQARERRMRSFEQYASEGMPEQETTVEFLLKQLQGVKRITPSTEAVPLETPVEEGGSAKIVTATLAEIYANQGQYREAVRAYRVLMEQRPEDAPRYQQRMAELEDLARSQRPGEAE